MAIPARLLDSRSSALAGPIACGCALLAGAVYVVAQDPSEGGFVPCPFRSLTGQWCVGCGLTRATHHLFRGNIETALRFNLFVVPVLAMIVLGWVSWMLTASGRPFDWAKRIPAWGFAAMIVVGIAFAVIRNLPGVDGLRG